MNSEVRDAGVPSRSWSLPSCTALAAPCAAQDYPDRVVKIVNPYPAGGSVDITARILAQKLSDNTGHSFIVETRSGAGGNTGSDSVAKSEPDGYTLLFTAPGPLTVNQTLSTQAAAVRSGEGLRADRDLRAHADRADGQPNPAGRTNVKDLIDYAKANPGKVNFGSAGIGTIPHLSGELFKSMAKVEITHVPYRGTAPAMTDLVGGHIQMMFDLLPSSLPQINPRRCAAWPTPAPSVPIQAEGSGADGRRAGAARLRNRVVGRAGRACAYAGAGAGQVARRSRQGDGVAGHRQAAGGPRLETGNRGRDEGARLPRSRDEEVGRGDPGVGGDGGVASVGSIAIHNRHGRACLAIPLDAVCS